MGPFLIIFLFSLTAGELLKKIDESRLPERYEVLTQMRNHLKDGRLITYEFRGVVDREIGSYFEILKPPREAGRKFLLRDQNLWMYAPEVGRVLRLSARDRFLGSEFSNSDLMESSYEKNYNAVSLDSIDNSYILKIEGNSPKSPYKEIILIIRKSNLVPLELKMYTMSGRLFREMVMDSIKYFEGQPYATYIKMTNVFIPENYTEVRLLSIHSRKKVPSSLFKPENLGR
ncbi:outer membrane lipoprotein-sorting protein [candidate division WOR-3 bacterium]|nr:outer membrane lipoprotein-sorting protein [candidate division WOR-3 bacterium]MCK4526956.1 outer membrane lipoprotein-sorting protein [candidate division WOR-3 bacterium]